MKGILVYQSPDKEAQLPDFIESLEPRLREKIIMRLYQLSRPQKPEMKEPHFKRFSLERYGNGRDRAGRLSEATLFSRPVTGCIPVLLVSDAPAQ